MLGISKKFGQVSALDGVGLRVEPGKIHAVVGENGAGKTTLMKILYGACQPDSGEIKIGGGAVRFPNPDSAIAAGVGMVSQHYAVIPELTCLQNLMLGAEPGFMISRATAESRADGLARQMGFEFDWGQSSSALSPGQAQKLEILKLLWRNAKIIILDEPTAMLAPEDADLLYSKLHELAAQGATVIVVTHRLPDVMEHCQDVTVLRGGKLVWSGPVSQTNPADLAEKMVGQSVPGHVRQPAEPGDPILEVQDFSVRGDRGDQAVKSIGFSLHTGELVGIAGVDGNGQRELFHALMGLRPATGKALLMGRDLAGVPTAQRIADGMRLIAEDRHDEAVIEEWSIADNAILGLQRTPGLKKGVGIDRAAQRALAEAATQRFPTKFANIDQPFRDLSGGNQQKVVSARALLQNPKVVLAFQPTRGIDLYVADLVFRGLVQATREGATCLVVSFDLDELMAYCDRILVMNDGQLTEVPAEQRDDRAVIGRMMVGAVG